MPQIISYSIHLATVPYSLREIAVRLHHRLVSIHPFPNGNGRFSRLFADLLVLTNGQKRFSCGRGNLIEDGVVRKNYLAALKAADRNEYGQLFNFADS